MKKARTISRWCKHCNGSGVDPVKNCSCGLPSYEMDCIRGSCGGIRFSGDCYYCKGKGAVKVKQELKWVDK